MRIRSAHPFKHRLALVVNGVCVLRYDNEAGKGDHKHLDDREIPYQFTDPDRLVEDFWSDVSRVLFRRD
ncbi:toxin-antitoxin system TumE family protein [Halochromatium glycolicum]|uniref:toxin-antitoxin system TumE family protein n=1 Tax=Halochromatium glycolicum TaxID=85075 RepID=UPI0030B8168C